MSITNTKQNPHPEWLMGGNPQAIEKQEAQGQQEVVNAAVLPTNVTNREMFESAGVVFGEPLADDPLFCNATLPEGWTKRATEHRLWTELVDEHGGVRGSIFYKAAFYDRDAFMRPA